MPINHILTATTPDDPAYEIQVKHWNSAHSVSLVGSEIIGAFSNDAAYNVSFSTNGGGFVVASANVTAAPSPVNITGANGSSVNAQTLAFSNANGVTLGVSTAANGATVTGSHNALTSQSNQAFSAQGGSSAFQTLIFTNSNGISFSNTGGSVWASHNAITTGRASTDAIGLNTAQSNVTWTANSSGLSLDARGYAGTGTSATNASVTLNSNGLAISVAAPGGAASQTMYMTGNTTVNSSGTAALSSLLMRGYGIVSLGTSNGSVLVSTPDPVTLAPNWYAVGNTTGASSSSTIAVDTISIQGTGGVSVGFSNGSIVISGNTGGGGGVNAANLLGANTSGNTTATGSTLGFSGVNMTLSGTNASQIVFSVPATSSLSATGNASLSVNGSTISVGANAAAVSLSGNSTSAGGGYSNVSTGTLILAGGNNITLSQNGASVTISGANAGGAQTGISSVIVSDATYTSGAVSFSNVNGISFGSSAGQAITASYTVPTVTDYFSKTNTTFNGANISGSLTMNTAGLQMSLSVAAPGAAAENNNHNLLGANTAGNTTASGSTIGLSGINLTLSGTNGSVINISAPATSSLVGFNGNTVSSNGSTISVGPVMGSYFDNFEGMWPNSTLMQGMQSTSHIQPFYIPGPVSFDFIRIPMSLAPAASSTGVTTGNSQFSYGLTRSHNFAIYTRGVGASSMSLQSIGSTQLTDQQSINVSAAAGNSTQFSYSNRATYQMSTGVQGVTMDYSSSAASLNFHTSHMTAVSGAVMMDFMWASSLSPGQYWLMYGVSSSSTSQYTNQGSRMFVGESNYGMSMPNLQFRTINATTNNSVGPFPGQGSFTTAGGGTTASLPISAVTTSGSHNKMMFGFMRIA